MRVLAAIVVAPLAAPAVVALAIIAAEPRGSGVAAGLTVGMFTALFAYAATIVFGVPMYVWLRHSRIRLRTAAGLGAAIGLLVFSLYSVLVRPTPGLLRLAVFFATSAVAGAASASTFFLIAARPVRLTNVER
ncbi:MAG TPA: hypothetical protein VEK11_24405 [Thermoanaerobaculia bacterium]|jgi:hypothetical protein|nr:hypothetical protein [Thermoanaerobaculia bacterium]